MCTVYTVCPALKAMRSCVLDFDNSNPSFTNPECQFLSFTMNWISLSTFCERLAFVSIRDDIINCVKLDECHMDETSSLVKL